jgi:hypothetical protein
VNATTTFETDLITGLEAERLALEILRREYRCATQINAYKGYDIWIPELHSSVEVKADLASNQTGNFVIETEFNGKPSGLTTTEATYWFLYDGNELAMTTPKAIRKFIDRSGAKEVSFTGRGDTKPKRAYLLPKKELFEASSVIWSKDDV